MDDFVRGEIVKIEMLLGSLGQVREAQRAQVAARKVLSAFNVRSMVVAIIVFVCVPGAATATFFIGSDETDVLPIGAQNSLGKSDRLPSQMQAPLAAWTIIAKDKLLAAFDERDLQTAALSPVAIRGRVEDERQAIAPHVTEASPHARRPVRRDTRGARPITIAHAPEEAPAPSFLERLFSVRFL